MSYQPIETPKGEEHLSSDSRPQVQVRKAITVAKLTPTALSPSKQERLTNSTTQQSLNLGNARNSINDEKSQSGLRKIKQLSFGSEPFERGSV